MNLVATGIWNSTLQMGEILDRENLKFKNDPEYFIISRSPPDDLILTLILIFFDFLIKIFGNLLAWREKKKKKKIPSD